MLQGHEIAIMYTFIHILSGVILLPVFNPSSGSWSKIQMIIWRLFYFSYCLLTGNPRPNITWWVENQLLDGEAEVVTEDITLNKLKLPPLTPSDNNREVTCVASNSQIIRPLTDFVKLSVISECCISRKQIASSYWNSCPCTVISSSVFTTPVPKLNTISKQIYSRYANRRHAKIANILSTIESKSLVANCFHVCSSIQFRNGISYNNIHVSMNKSE